MNMDEHIFDIAVVGAGHAGNEAAYIASCFQLKVVLITMPNVPIGSTPCNPAIGGVGKGQVVREIDALGGLMGKIADLTGIQYRTLNDSRGYSVQSTRVQVDKELYSKTSENILLDKPNLTIIKEKVQKISTTAYGFEIIVPRGTISVKKVIVTTGTFLAGKTHCGSETKNNGRLDSESSDSLVDILSEIQKREIRFKTGTPPRLKKTSLDYSKFFKQESDPNSLNFHYSFSPTTRHQKQLTCYIAHTNEDCMNLIRENRDSSPLFNGQINGVGPRYCPSIEDKAFRYTDRNVHHVFVEPEGLEIETMYPNGISTSLPKNIQEDFLRKIDGFENVEIVHFGYAVEYDVIDTTNLDLTLQHKNFPGLYFAGQVNGTSGYEEAAGQGLVAGVNASLSLLGKPRFILNRLDSYIGVMIEDLVTQERDEPYRLFTARNENRLRVREDNTYLRMASYRKNFGLHEDLDDFLEMFHVEHLVLTQLCKEISFLPNPENQEKFKSLNYIEFKNKKILLTELLKLSHIDPVEVLKRELSERNLIFDTRVIRNVAIDIKYQDYIDKNEEELLKVKKMQDKKVDLRKVEASENISFECKVRILKIKPETFGQLNKINGLRPATIVTIANDFY